MDYVSTDSIPYFTECAAAVQAAGYALVELQVVPQHGSVAVTAVIASKDPAQDIGVSDCAKAHHALVPVLLSVLHKAEDDLQMSVCSPGIERSIKNAAEFALFAGREIRVWDRTVSDWVRGTIRTASESAVVLEQEGGATVEISYENIAKAKFIHL